MTVYTLVSAEQFVDALRPLAEHMGPRGDLVRLNLDEDATKVAHYVYRTNCYLSEDGQSGFAVRFAETFGELISVFSAERGRGDDLVEAAIERGARHLDCFAGHLTDLYGRHGFVTTVAVPNWTPGEPSVHYMERPQA